MRGPLPTLLAAVLLAFLPALAAAFDPFVVKDIRVEGVQRTEAGTVFSYPRSRSASAWTRSAPRRQ
jgi:outer membrane protein insertion porin family